MNRKASDDVLMSNVIYIILTVTAFALTFFIVRSHYNGASTWEEFYSKELTKVINLAESGDAVILDIHKATEIALDNEVPFNEIFAFDNLEKEICVKLSKGRKTCYSYFNNVDVVNYEVKIAQPEKNVLVFEIREAQK